MPNASSNLIKFMILDNVAIQVLRFVYLSVTTTLIYKYLTLHHLALKGLVYSSTGRAVKPRVVKVVGLTPT